MTTSPPSSPVSTDLKRELGLFDAVMINAGTMIASAIFIVPATVAAAVQGTAVMTLVWVIGGIVSLLGALSVAELAAAYPEAGGQYAYLREAYGTVWAFLYGWSNFSVINTASITAIAVGFAKYIGFFTPVSESGIRVIAILSIIGLTVLNCRGVRLGATTQNVLTTLKIGALTLLVVTSFVIPGGSVSHFQPLWPSEPVGHWIGAFGVAMVAVLWAYDGWIETTYVGSEIVNPGRNLPRSIILSTVMVMVLFVLASVAFAYVLGPGAMAVSALVASDAAKVTMGSLGATLVRGACLESARRVRSTISWPRMSCSRSSCSTPCRRAPSSGYAARRRSSCGRTARGAIQSPRSCSSRSPFGSSRTRSSRRRRTRPLVQG